MCMFGGAPKLEPVAAPILAAGSEAARREGSLEARMRRARAGAAADVLTGPEGLGGGLAAAARAGAPAMTFGGV